MNWHAVTHVALPVLWSLAAIALGVLLGRRWRRELREALNYRQSLENRNAASSTSTATAQASGNVVNLHVGGQHDELTDGRGVIYLPPAVRSEFDSRRLDRPEALSSGDLVSVPEPVAEYRPTALSRIVFGSGHRSTRTRVSRQSRAQVSRHSVDDDNPDDIEPPRRLRPDAPI